MKGLIYILRLFILFLIAFALSRFIFLCYFFPLFREEPWASIILSFYHAWRVDTSAAFYLLLFPVFSALIGLLVYLKPIAKIRRIYVLFVLFANALISSVDLCLYKEWGVKTDFKALLYLEHPGEVFYTATISQIFLVLFFTAIQTWLTWLLYKRIIRHHDDWKEGNKPVSFFLYVLMFPVLLIGIRGGIQEIPIQASDAYYSRDPHLNWSAVNSLWNFAQSIVVGKRYTSHNPYQFLEARDAKKTVADLYLTKTDSTVNFLKDQHPNIVLIIFEGWSAELIGSISGDKEHTSTPHFDTLAAEGLLFTDCIASGERSDQGVTAILSSFPSLPLSSIVNYPDKVNRLPSLLKPFQQMGYNSLFLFGGQLSYGNLKALVYHNAFDKVIEERDIDPKIYRGRLGVHDEHTFDILFHELNGMKQPFFSGFFTQSTHFSYDYPKAKKDIAWAGDQSDYVNALMYADSCLGDFFEKAKRQPWYAQTLFILVADHGHFLPRNTDHRDVALHHIPLLFYGDLVKDDFRGMKKELVVSQQDICATLLAQLHLPHDNFKWSKDIMNPATSSFAYWTFEEGFGFTRDKHCQLVYDLANKQLVSSDYLSCDSIVMKRQGFSYVQRVFDDFLSQ